MSFWQQLTERVEDVVATIGGYDPRSERAKQKFAATCVLLGSTGFVAGTTCVLLWKLGAIQPMLPQKLRTKVEDVANRVAAATEPPRITRLHRDASRYLCEVYGTTALCFATSALGTYCFFKQPHFPLAGAVGLSAVPAFVILCLPRSHVNPNSRRALFLAGAFGSGYAFGPINWIASDSMVHVGVSVVASAAGFTASAIITRGKVSYFVLSQALSASLAIVGTNAVMRRTADFQRASARGKQSTAVANVNAVLMLQVCGNIALALAHSVPTLMRMEARAAAHDATRREHGLQPDETLRRASDDAEFGDDDVEREAYMIYGSVAYAVWWWFRMVTLVALKSVTRSDKKRVRPSIGEREEETLKDFMRKHEKLRRTSDFVASIFFLYAYVKAVGYLQRRANVQQSFDKARSVFAQIAPFALVA